MTAEAGDAVEADGLTFTYRGGERPALRDVSLALQAGEQGWLMGRTGAGKSTLCLCLNGVIPAMQPGQFAGEVRIGGQRISGRPVHEVAQRVGALFQDFEAQLLASDVEREVALGLENAGMPREQMRRRVAEALELVGLSELRGREPSTLSGGQKQRLALAAVLAPEPSVLVLDEPTTDLDPRGKQRLAEVLGELRDRGVTLLVAEHKASDALAADTLLTLRDGEKAFGGPPAELLRDPGRCRELGVLPLQMPELFERLGLSQRPLTPMAAAEALRAQGWALDEARYETLAREDRGPEGDVIIEVQDLTFTYPEGDAPALEEVSLSVREGEFVVILGENGSGKSTLARHLNGLLHPTSGTVRIAGQDTREAPSRELAQQVGYLFQNPDHQIFASTVREEVAFGPRNLGVPEDQVSERVSRALEVADLAGWEERDPFVLTKGERQRVALASVLACQPRVIVFDEPTTGLDGLQQRAMMDLLARLNDDGQTVLVITHCTWAAAEYARRAVVLDEGRLVADRPVRDLFADAELLTRTGQVAPAVARLSQDMADRTLLSVDEAAECIVRT
ncbi:MAG: energy-coupling factor transporter ATPase [Armatimonadota bacterium]|nr:energy-coupling factor transporter ATPase [Armatimonadota bacterium]